MNPTPPKREHKSDEGAIIPKSVEEIAKKLKGAGWVTIAEALTAFADAKVKEAMAPGYLDWSGRIRNEALEEAAQHLEKQENQMRGLADACQAEYAKMVRSLKSPGGSK